MNHLDPANKINIIVINQPNRCLIITNHFKVFNAHCKQKKTDTSTTN